MVTSFFPFTIPPKQKQKKNEHETFFLNLNFVTVRSATLDSTDSQTFHAPRGEEATVGERALPAGLGGRKKGRELQSKPHNQQTTLPKQNNKKKVSFFLAERLVA